MSTIADDDFAALVYNADFKFSNEATDWSYNVAKPHYYTDKLSYSPTGPSQLSGAYAPYSFQVAGTGSTTNVDTVFLNWISEPDAADVYVYVADNVNEECVELDDTFSPSVFSLADMGTDYDYYDSSASDQVITIWVYVAWDNSNNRGTLDSISIADL